MAMILKRLGVVVLMAFLFSIGAEAIPPAPVVGVPPVPGGCPALPAPAGFSWPFAGVVVGLHILPDGTNLARADFFTAATGGASGPGVCMSSVGGATYWFALPADPVRTGYSGAAGVLFGGFIQWDELIVQDAAGGLHDITPETILPVWTPRHLIYNYITEPPLTCLAGIGPVRNAPLKFLTWVDGGGGKTVSGGVPIGIQPCPVLAPGLTLSALPAAPVIAGARGIEGGFGGTASAGFAFAAASVENVQAKVAENAVPALGTPGQFALWALLALAFWLFRRPLRRLRDAR